MVLYFIGVYLINRTLHGHLEIENFSSRVEKIFHSFAALTCEICFNTRREIFVSLHGHVISSIHRIHKWRTRGKKLVPSHESEALEDKQKFQMKTFSELPECLARIPPKITLYGLLLNTVTWDVFCF